MTASTPESAIAVAVRQGDQLAGDQLLIIPLSQIRRNPNIDPRKGRNPQDFADLCASIDSQGVIQPILVRPIEGAEVPYEVVAGNSRFDGSVEVGKDSIPALVRVMSDAEARVAAAIENIQRANLTPIEEAWHCVRLLADSGNDHSEVCRKLGWSRKLLDSRVLLSKCCDEVATALVNGQIKLGHAELLAPLVPDEQRSICKAIIDRELTVAAARDRLMQLTPLISTARFDTSECAGCEHNSQRYSDLFSASVGEAKCQYRACWNKKTEELIQVKLIEAEADYGLVHTDLTLPADGFVLLAANGPAGVGTAQMNACMSCPRYGAVVSTSQGREGDVAGGYCFDKNCHADHVKAYQLVVAEANGETVAEEESAGAVGTDAAKKPAPVAGKKGPDSSAKGKAKPQEIKRSIKKVAFGMYGRMAQQAIQSSRQLTLAISIVSLYLDVRSDVPAEALKAATKDIDFPAGLSNFSRANFEVQLSALPVEALEQLLCDIAATSVLRRDGSDSFAKSISGAQSLAFIQAAQMNATDFFQMTEEYLKALTKPAIIQDCKVSGFAAKFDEAKGDKAFSKLTAGKVDDLIKAILEFTDFSWSGYLPEALKVSAHTDSATA